MYPDLSYLFHDLFGSAPDNWLSVGKTFGVFLILAFIVFLMVKQMNKLKKTAPAAPPPTPEDVLLLREIRDALKK